MSSTPPGHLQPQGPTVSSSAQSPSGVVLAPASSLLPLQPASPRPGFCPILVLLLLRGLSKAQFEPQLKAWVPPHSPAQPAPCHLTIAPLTFGPLPPSSFGLQCPPRLQAAILTSSLKHLESVSTPPAWLEALAPLACSPSRILLVSRSCLCIQSAWCQKPGNLFPTPVVPCAPLLKPSMTACQSHPSPSFQDSASGFISLSPQSSFPPIAPTSSNSPHSASVSAHSPLGIQILPLCPHLLQSSAGANLPPAANSICVSADPCLEKQTL